MFGQFVILALVAMAMHLGEAGRCYHCYEVFNKTTTSTGLLHNEDFGSKLVECDKNPKQWNYWDCPREWPVCVIISAKVNNHIELVRSCAVDKYCSQYVPPTGVQVKYCHECNTTLCNDYPPLPHFPDNDGPKFVFNVNINLDIKKLPPHIIDKDDDE